MFRSFQNLDGAEIDLVLSQGNEAKAAIEIKTTNAPALSKGNMLAFDTVNEVASTQARVTIDWSGHRLSARGMRADLKGETLRLESKVNGRFLPQ